MALQDCIEKFEAAGTPIRDDQIKALQEALANGMTDNQAVRTVYLQAHENVVDIASRAVKKGAKLAPVANAVTDLQKFQARALQKVADKQKGLKNEIEDLNDEYLDLSTTIGVVETYWKTLPGKTADLDLGNSQQVMEVLSSMLFNPRLRGILGRGSRGLKGKSPPSLFASFRSLQERQHNIDSRLIEIDEDLKRLAEQVATVFHGKSQTFNQDRKPALLPSKKLRIKGGDKTSDVLQNPTNSQFRAFRQSIRMEYKEKGWNLGTDPLTRSTYDANGNQWIWGSDQALHTVMEEDLAREIGVDPATLSQHNEGKRTFFQSELGLHSGLLTAAMTMPRESGTAQEMFETLKKQPNVKRQEMEAIGVEEWFEAMDKVGLPITRETLTKFIKNKGVKVTETTYQGDQPPTPDIFLQPTGQLDDGTYVYHAQDQDDIHGPTFEVFEDKDAGNVSVQLEDGTWLEIDQPMNRQTLLHAEGAIATYLFNHRTPKGSAGPVSWTDWTLPGPGGSTAANEINLNHREIVLSVPSVGGYTYTMDDLIESHHPAANDPAMSTERKAQVELTEQLYHFIDAIGAEDHQGVRYRQTFQIPKNAFPTIEKAKQYIIDEKPESPRTGENFTSHAFPQDNIITWMRITDRMGPNGELIMFVEETQSDLHQAGLTDGYQYTEDQRMRSLDKVGKAKLAVREMLEKVQKDQAAMWKPTDIMREFLSNGGEVRGDLMGDLSKKQRALMNKYLAANKENDLIQKGGPTPNMPFKGDAWAELAMKRIMRLAAEGNYDQVAWTSGAQQLERYNIDEHFDQITWDPRDEMLTTYDSNGRMIESTHQTQEELEELFGAERLLEMNRSIDQKRSEYTIAPVYLSGKQRSDMVGEELAFADATATTGPTLESMSPNDIVLDDIDQFIGTYERKWFEENGVAFALVDQNGEMVRQSGGDYQMWEYYDGATDGRDDLAFGDGLPELTNVDIVDEEGKGLRRRYDELLVNVSNRVIRKLDKNTKVKRLGIQMEGGDGFTHGPKIEREGGGNLVPGTVDPGAFYVEGYADTDNPVERTQISPRFDTYEEAEQWHDNMLEGYGYIQHGFEMTPRLTASVMEGMTLFQDRNRASITFDDKNRAIMRLTQSKDLSSFLHEMAHFYVEMIGDLAEMPDATDATKAQQVRMFEMMGVNSREEIGVDQHELYARSFEGYLREGVAPTAELQADFSQVKGWMIRIYRQIQKLLGVNEQLNDETREMFDRMVATEEQIASSESYMGYVALYGSAEEMSVSQRVYDIYSERMRQSHDEAVDHETKKAVKSMQWGEQQWWNAELKVVREEVRAEVEEEQVYQALAMLQKGTLPDGSKNHLAPFKLSKADLIARYGKDFMKRLPGRGKYSVYAVKGGIDADIAAQTLGYDSGDALIKALVGAPKMETYIKDESKRRMQERHPDPVNDSSSVDRATREVHNQKRGQVLGAELSALRKQQREDAKIVAATKKDIKEKDKQALEANKGQLPKRENLAHIKAAAKQKIASMRIRDVNPNAYLQAERKAGRLAFEAMGKKDYQTAYDQKRKQIMMFEAYRAAVRAKDQAAREHAYAKSFGKKRKRIKMGKAGILDQIDAILDGINLGQRSGKQLDMDPIRAELLPVLEAGIADGSLLIDPKVLDVMRIPDGKNWRELTFEELSGISDLLKQLESQADHTQRIKVNGEYVVLEEAATEIAASITANHKKVAPIKGTKTKMERGKEGLDAIGASLANPGHMAKLLDGMDDNGTFNRLIVIPIRRAISEKLMPMQEKALADVQAIFLSHYTRSEMQFFGRKGYAKLGDRRISKDEALSMALNQGTETNKEAFFGGLMIDGSIAYPPEEVAAILALLDENDWNFVQAIWDYNESYWAAFEKSQKERRGIASEKIEAVPFTVTSSDGVEMQMRGGFHHLSYDSSQSNRLKVLEFNQYHDDMGNGVFVSSNTRAGASYNRTQNHGEVVHLGLHVIQNHLREITRDMAIGNEINYVGAMLNNKEVQKAFKLTGNSHHLDALILWIADVSVGELAANHIHDKIVAIARTNFTMSRLLFNFRVGLLQFAGLTQTAAIVGKMPVLKAVVRYAGNPVAATKLAFGKSAFLAGRYEKASLHFDMAISDATERVSGGHGLPTHTKLVAEIVQKLGFAPIYLAQGVIDVVTWNAAYQKGLKNMSDAEAIVYADSQVQIAQTSGLWSDRSAFERGTTSANMRQNRWMRLWATLISFMVSRTVNVYIESKAFRNNVSLGGLVHYLGQLTMLLVVDSILVAHLYQKFDDEDDDDPDSWLYTVGKETVLGFLGGIPGVRDVESVAYASGNTAIGTAINDVGHIAIQTADGKFERKFWRHTIDLFGILTGAPTSTANKMIDVAMSDDPELIEYVLGKDRSKDE